MHNAKKTKLNNIPLKIKIICIGISILIFALLNYDLVSYYILWNGLEKITDYHFIISINTFDNLIFSSFPIFGLILNSKRKEYKNLELIIDISKILVSIAIVLGIATSLLIIFGVPNNPLIPKNLLTEPFNEYSVLALGIGILIPFLFIKRNEKLSEINDIGIHN